MQSERPRQQHAGVTPVDKYRHQNFHQSRRTAILHWPQLRHGPLLGPQQLALAKGAAASAQTALHTKRAVRQLMNTLRCQRQRHAVAQVNATCCSRTTGEDASRCQAFFSDVSSFCIFQLM